MNGLKARSAIVDECLIFSAGWIIKEGVLGGTVGATKFAGFLKRHSDFLLKNIIVIRSLNGSRMSFFLLIQNVESIIIHISMKAITFLVILSFTLSLAGISLELLSRGPQAQEGWKCGLKLCLCPLHADQKEVDNSFSSFRVKHTHPKASLPQTHDFISEYLISTPLDSTEPILLNARRVNFHFDYQNPYLGLLSPPPETLPLPAI